MGSVRLLDALKGALRTAEGRPTEKGARQLAECRRLRHRQRGTTNPSREPSGELWSWTMTMNRRSSSACHGRAAKRSLARDRANSCESSTRGSWRVEGMAMITAVGEAQSRRSVSARIRERNRGRGEPVKRGGRGEPVKQLTGERVGKRLPADFRPRHVHQAGHRTPCLAVATALRDIRPTIDLGYASEC
jgi:hypothetical protein